MMKSKKRIDEFDIAKGIAIIAMIIGHLGMKNLDMIVYPFHMPLFFIISGYFISKTDSFLRFVKKKLNGLILPYYSCAVIICISSIITNEFVKIIHSSFKIHSILSWGFAAIYGAGTNYLLPKNIISIGGIWFLQALFIASVIVKLLDILISNKYEYFKAIIVIFLAIASYVSSKYIWLPLNIQTGLFSTIYVYVGYFIKQRFNYETIKEKYLVNAKWFSIFTIIFVVSIFLEQGKFNIANLSIEAGIIGIISSFSNSFLIIVVSSVIKDHTSNFKNILIWLGRNSLYILCVHIWQLDLVPNPIGIFEKILPIFGFENVIIFSKILIVIFFVLFATIMSYLIIEIKKYLISFKQRKLGGQ